MGDVAITVLEKRDSKYYVFFPFGNISAPIMILQDWQLKGLMKEVGLEVVPIKNVRG